MKDLEKTINDAANKYIGHAPEIDEDVNVSMRRNAFIDGAKWIAKNFKK